MDLLLQVSAHLWDGHKQLPGKLSLTPKNLFFHFDDFQKSHLNLQVPLLEIKKAETFLLYDLAKNGLKITSSGGQIDLFILADPEQFKKIIFQTIELKK